VERETFYHTDKEGITSEIDIITGRVVARSASIENMAIGKNLPITEAESHKSLRWKYSHAYGDFICQKIAEGLTMTELTELPGMPSLGIVTRWRAENPVFDEGIRLARKARAERVYDEIYDSRDHEYATKEEMQSAKLSFDKKKFLAGADDPDTYGAKSKVEGTGDVHVTIQVDTGIDRTPTIEVEKEDIEIIEEVEDET